MIVNEFPLVFIQTLLDERISFDGIKLLNEGNEIIREYLHKPNSEPFLWETEIFMVEVSSMNYVFVV